MTSPTKECSPGSPPFLLKQVEVVSSEWRHHVIISHHMISSILYCHWRTSRFKFQASRHVHYLLLSVAFLWSATLLHTSFHLISINVMIFTPALHLILSIIDFTLSLNCTSLQLMYLFSIVSPPLYTFSQPLLFQFCTFSQPRSCPHCVLDWNRNLRVENIPIEERELCGNCVEQVQYIRYITQS